MKSNAKGSSFTLFFIEMAVMIVFFGLSAAVVMRVFAESSVMASESERSEQMAFCAQSAAEIFSGCGDIEYTSHILFSAYEDKIPVDENCAYSPDDPKMYVSMTETDEEYPAGILKTMKITFTDINGKCLYEVTSGAYLPETEADGNG